MAAYRVTIFFWICIVMAMEFPVGTADQQYKQEHCIQMTQEKEDEIQTIVSKISNFLHKLAEDHHDFDLRLVKIDIESHRDDEEEEKIVQIPITINDCEEIVTEKRITPVKNDASVDGFKDLKPIPFSTYYLQLGKNGEELLRLAEEIRGRKMEPFLAYVQPKEDIVFFRK